MLGKRSHIRCRDAFDDIFVGLQHVGALLAAPDTSVVLSALQTLVSFVRKTHSSSTRLQASAGINTRLLALCQGWGGKEQVSYPWHEHSWDAFQDLAIQLQTACARMNPAGIRIVYYSTQYTYVDECCLGSDSACSGKLHRHCKCHTITSQLLWFHLQKLACANLHQHA